MLWQNEMSTCSAFRNVSKPKTEKLNKQVKKQKTSNRCQSLFELWITCTFKLNDELVSAYIVPSLVAAELLGNQLAVGYISVSIALTTFILILAYHIFPQLRCNKLWKKVPKLNLEPKKLKTKQKVHNPNSDPTESVNLDQLHEPWLEELLQHTHSSLRV